MEILALLRGQPTVPTAQGLFLFKTEFNCGPFPTMEFMNLLLQVPMVRMVVLILQDLAAVAVEPSCKEKSN
jgi:hypothetical protein